ncbi:unnamed protein product, partial [Amoebophrya sp. A25]
MAINKVRFDANAKNASDAELTRRKELDKLIDLYKKRSKWLRRRLAGGKPKVDRETGDEEIDCPLDEAFVEADDSCEDTALEQQGKLPPMKRQRTMAKASAAKAKAKNKPGPKKTA